MMFGYSDSQSKRGRHQPPFSQVAPGTPARYPLPPRQVILSPRGTPYEGGSSQHPYGGKESANNHQVFTTLPRGAAEASPQQYNPIRTRSDLDNALRYYQSRDSVFDMLSPRSPMMILAPKPPRQKPCVDVHYRYAMNRSEASTHAMYHPYQEDQGHLYLPRSCAITTTFALQPTAVQRHKPPTLPDHARFLKEGKTYGASSNSPATNRKIPQPTSPAKRKSKAVPGNNSKKLKVAPRPTATLTAYNFFFREERNRLVTGVDESEPYDLSEAKKKALLSTDWRQSASDKRRKHRRVHGKVTFQELSTTICKRWKALPDNVRAFFKELQVMDSKRYKKENAEFTKFVQEVIAREASLGDDDEHVVAA